MNPLIVRKSRWRYVVPFIGSSVLVGIGAYYTIDREPTWFSVILTAFFFSMAAFHLEQIVRPKPCLIISVKGINVDYLKIGTISWSDLSGAFIQREGDVDHICFTLRNPEEFRVRIGSVGRVFNAATQQAGYGDFTLKSSDLGLDTRVVFDLVREQIGRAKDKQTGTNWKYPAGPS